MPSCPQERSTSEARSAYQAPICSGNVQHLGFRVVPSAVKAELLRFVASAWPLRGKISQTERVKHEYRYPLPYTLLMEVMKSPQNGPISPILALEARIPKTSFPASCSPDECWAVSSRRSGKPCARSRAAAPRAGHVARRAGVRRCRRSPPSQAPAQAQARARCTARKPARMKQNNEMRLKAAVPLFRPRFYGGDSNITEIVSGGHGAPR